MQRKTNEIKDIKTYLTLKLKDFFNTRDSIDRESIEYVYHYLKLKVSLLDYYHFFLQSLELNTSIRILDLSTYSGYSENIDIIDTIEPIQYLSKSLMKNTSITDLNLALHFIDCQGIKEISNALRINKTIKKINLFNNRIREDGIKEISDVLKINNTITDIGLGFNFINKEAMNYLGEALIENNSIKRIELSNLYRGDEGFEGFFEALKINTSITSLNLSNNFIGKKNMDFLSNIIKNNHSIQTLELSSVNLDNNYEGIELGEFFEALKINTSITYLNLSNNFIANEKLRILCDGIMNNKTILYLNLNGIRFSFENNHKRLKYSKKERMYLYNAFEINKSIIKLNLDGNEKDYETFINRNNNLYQLKRNNLLNLFSILLKL
jgi:Ran GTPase-activating protein (RanGAP) involved in mRNA processing and transport